MSHRYCGRDFHPDEIALIGDLIAEDPGRTPAELSRLTCRALAWRKADGGLKEMSARIAMLRMHEDGLIALPAPRCKRPDQRVRIGARSDPGEPLAQPARALTPLALRRVRTKGESRLYNEYIQRYHYPGHKPLPGAQLRYIVYSAAQPIALLGFGAAAWMSAPRDRYIGWTHDQRKRNLSLIVNNARFHALGKGGQDTSAPLARRVWIPPGSPRDLCRETPFPRHLLQGCQLGLSGPDQRPR
jgi:hypothetical protein